MNCGVKGAISAGVTVHEVMVNRNKTPNKTIIWRFIDTPLGIINDLRARRLIISFDNFRFTIIRAGWEKLDSAISDKAALN